MGWPILEATCGTLLRFVRGDWFSSAASHLTAAVRFMDTKSCGSKHPRGHEPLQASHPGTRGCPPLTQLGHGSMWNEVARAARVSGPTIQFHFGTYNCVLLAKCALVRELRTRATPDVNCVAAEIWDASAFYVGCERKLFSLTWNVGNHQLSVVCRK